MTGVQTCALPISNAAQVALAEAYVKGQFPADDGGFACTLLEQTVDVALSITWAASALTWTDATPWPPYVPASKVRVSNAVAPTTTSCRLFTGISTTVPQVGQTIGFFDRPNKTFRRKKILTVSVVTPNLVWDVTFDTTNNASDVTYAPVIGTAASPWSDSLDTLIEPIVGYFDTLGPGEQVASFPDPGQRQRRSPQSPTSWPNTITNRILAPLFDLTSIEDLDLEEPATPLNTTVGVPGVLAYLMTLGDLAAFVK